MQCLKKNFLGGLGAWRAAVRRRVFELSSRPDFVLVHVNFEKRVPLAFSVSRHRAVEAAG